MARTLKPYKVSSVTNSRTGVCIDIFLDRELKTFFGVVGNVKIGADTEQECENKIAKVLQDYSGLDWKKYIQIDFSVGENCKSYDHFGNVVPKFEGDLRIARLEGAESIQGTWMQRPFKKDSDWQDQKMKRWHTKEQILRGQKRHGIVLIPYTRQAWRLLNEIINRLTATMDQLIEFLKEDDLELKLKASFVKALLPEK